MTTSETILATFGADDVLTYAEMAQRSGLSLEIVLKYSTRLRDYGWLERVSSEKPVTHRLAGARRIRAQMAEAAAAGIELVDIGSIVGHACRTQPRSVFDLGRFA